MNHSDVIFYVLIVAVIAFGGREIGGVIRKRKAERDALRKITEEKLEAVKREERKDDDFRHRQVLACHGELTTTINDLRTSIDARSREWTATLSVMPASLQQALTDSAKENYELANGYLLGIQRCCEAIATAADKLTNPVTTLAGLVAAPPPNTYPTEQASLGTAAEQDLIANLIGYKAAGKTASEADALVEADRQTKAAFGGIELNFD